MSGSQNNPLPSSSAPGPKVDRRRNRQKARAQFDSSAPKISVDKFFSDFTQNRRNNVEFDFDVESLKRLDAVYLPKVREFAEYSSRIDFDPNVLVAQIRLLIRCAVFRKLVLATPSSQDVYISKYKFVQQIELFAPPSLLAAIDHIGKVEFDDFVCRFRNNVYVIHCMALEVVRSAFKIDSFKNCFDDALRRQIERSSFNNCFFFDKSSCDALKAESNEFLKNLYELDFEVDLGNAVCRLSYPRLKVVSEEAEQIQNIIDWFNKLHENMPEINRATQAALCTLISERWFSGLNFNRPLNQVVPGLPDWITLSPSNFLTQSDLLRFKYNDPESFSSNYIQALQEAFSYVQDFRSGPLNSILKFSKMSDNAFGSKSQIVQIPDRCFDDKALLPFDQLSYFEAKQSVHGECLFKLKEKGLVTNQLLFSFTKNIEYKSIYEARLNGNVLNTRKMYLNPDFRFIN